MKIQDACLPCITAQTVSCAALIPEADRPAFYRSVFHTLAQLDFNQPAPAAIGSCLPTCKTDAANRGPLRFAAAKGERESACGGAGAEPADQPSF